MRCKHSKIYKKHVYMKIIEHQNENDLVFIYSCEMQALYLKSAETEFSLGLNPSRFCGNSLILKLHKDMTFYKYPHIHIKVIY